jgi:2'-5' RNA ligase
MQQTSFKKYFIAIVVPEPFLSEVEAVKMQLFSKYQLKGALRSPAHITLHRPFTWKTAKEAELISALKEFKSDSSFELHLDNYNFFEPRVVFIDVRPDNQLLTLHSKLTDYCRQKLRLFNESEDERGFAPHVTVAFRDLKKPLFYELQKEFRLRSFEAKFPFQGFSLLRLENKWEEIAFFPRT